jgi:hypothetical protein
MASVADSLGLTNTQLAGVLAQSVDAISQSQTVAFTKYVKKVLPLDGYVFWLKGETISVKGSLHYASQRVQEEDATYASNTVLFTATQEIQPFNDINPQTMWVALYAGMQFAFSSRGSFYEQSGLYHYSGTAVYSTLATQLIDDPTTLLSYEPIVSNSLPVWLTVGAYSPVWLQPPNPGLTLYPSFLSPQNYAPPYGTVHIEPGMTEAMQAAPYIDSNSSHFQLAKDHVKITLYGVSNATALTFVDAVMQYSVDTDVIGIMNMPIMRDGKKPQSDIQAIAMQKIIEFDISYYQTRVNQIARQLITKAVMQYYVAPYTTTA